MPVQWGLGVTPDIGGNAMRAYEQGRAQKKEEQGQNALTAYATDPSEGNLNGLAPYNPQFVIQQRQQMQQQQQDAQGKQILGDALANPDPQARAAARQRLAYVNAPEYQKLGVDQKKQADEGMKAIGQLAFSILQKPPEQQGPALAEALRGLQAQGMDVSSLDLSGGPEQVLMSALAMTGQLDQWEQFSRPSYQQKGEFGQQGFQFGQPIPEGGQPGSVQEGATAINKQTGQRLMFKGGQWVPAGGAGGNVSGGFHP